MDNVMVDLETLGTESGAVILSIGAVFFDPFRKTLGREYHKRILLEESGQYGFQIDIGTLRFWLEQPDEVRTAVFEKRDSLPVAVALGTFLEFCLNMPTEEAAKVKDLAEWEQHVKEANVKVWGNGASFDNVLLSTYYRRAKIIQPWSYNNDRCYRTLKNANRDITLERVGVAHNALDDAKSQALHAIDIMRAINYGGCNNER